MSTRAILVDAVGASARAGKFASMVDAKVIKATMRESIFLEFAILMGCLLFDDVMVMAFGR